MPFIDEIAARLVAQGVGTINHATTNGIYRSSQAKIPAGEGPFITITDTGGSGSTRVHNSKSAETHLATAQIVTRAAKYEVALAKAMQAYNALDGIYNTTLSGTFYQHVRARQLPTDIGLDDSSRPMLSFNIDAQKQPS